MQGYLHRITITVAVALRALRVCPPHQGRWRLPPKAFLSPKEVVTMISIDTVIAVITLVITSVGLGLQFASYMNTKNNRRSHED